MVNLVAYVAVGELSLCLYGSSQLKTLQLYILASTLGLTGNRYPVYVFPTDRRKTNECREVVFVLVRGENPPA